MRKPPAEANEQSPREKGVAAFPTLCSLHWSDLHQALLNALPEGLVHFRHTVTSTEQPEGSQRVTVRVERRISKESEETEALQLECDVLVAADGSMSATRRRLRPDESRRCVASDELCRHPNNLKINYRFAGGTCILRLHSCRREATELTPAHARAFQAIYLLHVYLAKPRLHCTACQAASGVNEMMGGPSAVPITTTFAATLPSLLLAVGLRML